MNKEMILKSDVLDIVFENRNKAYGAYDLRKFYNNRLIKSLSVMLGAVVVLSAFTFLPKKKAKAEKEIYVTSTYTFKEAKKEEPKEKEKPKEQVKAKPPVTTQVYAKPVVAPKDTYVPPIASLKDSVVISDVAVTGKPGTVAVVGEIPKSTDGDGPGVISDPVVTVDINKPMGENEVDVMPSYPGGMEALRKFLARNLHNPKEMEAGEAVSVKMRFVVDYNGKLKGFTTVEDGGEEFNQEVMRVLKKMPQWNPGKSRGQDVSVYYTIPVKFVAADE